MRFCCKQDSCQSSLLIFWALTDSAFSVRLDEPSRLDLKNLALERYRIQHKKMVGMVFAKIKVVDNCYKMVKNSENVVDKYCGSMI